MDRGPGGTAPAAGGSGRWRGAVLALVVGLTAVAAVGISRLRLDDDLRSLLRDNAADFRLIDEVSARFGAPDRDCIVQATARSGDVFDERPLGDLRSLSAALAAVPGVVEVRSIFDVRRQGIAGALLPVIPHTDVPLDEDARAAARSRAVGHPFVAGHLLSADAASSLMLVRLDEAANAAAGLGPAIDRIEDAIAAARRS